MYFPIRNGKLGLEREDKKSKRTFTHMYFSDYTRTSVAITAST